MEKSPEPPVWWQAGLSSLARDAVVGTAALSKTLPSILADHNLEALMARYQAGDFGAAGALIETVSPQLHRFFVVRIASRTDADDLLQETWLRIHRIRHTYRQGEPVLPWLYAVARHVRIDHYRKAVRTNAREHPLEELPDAAAELPWHSLERDRLETMVAALPDSQREVIELLKIEGLSLEEVARVTSSTVGSVKQKAHRAYRKLRQAMSGFGIKKSPPGEKQ